MLDTCTVLFICDCICSSEPSCNMAVYGVSMRDVILYVNL